MMLLKPRIEFQFNSELEKKSKGGLLIKISWNVVGEHDKHQFKGRRNWRGGEVGQLPPHF